MSNNDGEAVPVVRNSEEYSRIIYLLQLALRSTSVDEVKAWRVSNPHLNVQFERRTSTMLCLESWVDAARLSTTNHVQDVCNRGFHIADGSKGLSFKTGAMSIDHPPAENGQYQFLLCKIGVGRSFVLDDPDEEQELPPGYDSFYLHRPESSAGYDKYHHEYIIPDSAQVMPQYIVHFKHTPNPAPSPGSDVQVTRQRFRSDISSVRQKVIDALAVLGPAAGDQTEKMLQQITENYEAALNASQQADPLLTERVEAIDETIDSITQKVAEIQQNHKEVEDAIYSKMQEVLYQLNSNTEKKIAVLLSEELELRRQKQQINWTENFVSVLRENLPPMTFISTWEKHSAMRRALYAQSGGRIGVKSSRGALDEVQCDLKLAGHLEVVSESELKMLADADHAETLVGQEASEFAQHTHDGSKKPQQHLNTGLTGVTWASTHPSNPSGNGTWESFMSHRNQSLEPVKPVHRLTFVDTETMGQMSDRVQQAQHSLKAAQDELEASENIFAALHPSQKSSGELLVQQARARAAEAEAAYSSALAETAHATSKDQEARSTSVVPRGTTAASVSSLAASTPFARQPTPAQSSKQNMLPMSEASVAVVNAQRSPTRRPVSQKNIDVLVSRYSLRTAVEARRRRLGEDIMSAISPARAFADSRIVQGDEAMTLYMSLPFEQTFSQYPTNGETGPSIVLPQTSLIFSTYNNYAHIGDFKSSYQEYIERIGGSVPAATVVLIRSGDRRFGGFAADPWLFDDTYHGSPKSFLFMISPHTCKIPFQGRTKGPEQESDYEARALHEQRQQAMENEYMMDRAQIMQEMMSQGVQFDEDENVIQNPQDVDLSVLDIPPPRRRPWVRHDAQRSNAETIQFGIEDLILSGDLSSCSSSLEHSYGIGLKPKSADAKRLLSGSDNGEFSVDVMEVWAVEYDGMPGAASGNVSGETDGAYQGMYQ